MSFAFRLTALHKIATSLAKLTSEMKDGLRNAYGPRSRR
jgi:hypothetical protein